MIAGLFLWLLSLPKHNTCALPFRPLRPTGLLINIYLLNSAGNHLPSTSIPIGRYCPHCYWITILQLFIHRCKIIPMPRHRLPPNPNTRYGRKRMREDFQYKYHNVFTPEERSQNDFYSCCAMVVILIIVGGLILLIGGSEALLKWMK